jgi:crotonobetainyl-CoA:carnitine CoA-transferase CaiB-like acyl-CoA transferase
MRLPQLEQAGIVERGDDGAPRPGPAAWACAADRPAPRQAIQADGPRLAGLRVLDLSSMVAGPVCGRTLAEYGAEVVKLDSPHPHHGPRLTCWYGVDVNQGKRSLLLDLAAPEGRAAFDLLLARADVVLHNFSDAACARLRLDAATLDAARPGVVVARIGAFRGPRPGPWDGRKGYDPVLQAASGIMLRYGGGRPVHHGIASCVDYLTGYLAAWAVTLGLLRRARTGRGGEVATSLAQAATLIQLPFALREEGAPDDEPSGQWAWGAHALQRLHCARDGWIFLAAAPEARGAVCASLGLAADAPDAALAAAVRRETRAALAMRLAGHAIVAPVDPLDRLPAVPANPPGTALPPGGALRAVLSRGPGGETIRTLAPSYARSDAAPLIQLAPAPRLGADTRAILAEAGLGTEAVARLVGAGIASDGVSDRLLPG